MPRFPYMNFPFPSYKTTPKSFGRIYNTQNSIVNSNNHTPSIISNPIVNDAPKKEEEKNKSNNNTADYLFDLFGLKIYYDDILLISLIYFLYSEGVKDDGLFLVLILLLLS